jgi:hypothetical protein
MLFLQDLPKTANQGLLCRTVEQFREQEVVLELPKLDGTSDKKSEISHNSPREQTIAPS